MKPTAVGERRAARGGRFRLKGCPGVVTGVLAVVMCGLVSGCVSEEQIKKADGYYKEGAASLNTDQQSAFVSFQMALKENPRHRDAHYGVALIYAQQEKIAQAEAEVQEVLDIDPNYPEAYNFLGQLLVRQNRWDEAIEAYRKALGFPLYATPDVALYELGVALEHEGDMQGAMQAFEDALRVNPPNVPQALIHLELGRAHYRLGADVKARESLVRAVSLDKDKNGAVAAEAKRLMERLKPQPPP